MAYTTIDKGSDYFNTVLYTGTGSALSVTGVGFQPDWVWIKNRPDARDHQIYDAVRGATKVIGSDRTAAESTQANGLTAFGSDGFTVGSDANVNDSGDSHVSWNWLGANGTASNTDGSITSTVSANTTSGFSIVSYTGTGSNATVGHGLGVAPKMVIFKNRDNGTQEWDSYHVGLTDATYFIQLNSSNAESNTNGALRFNSTAPSTNFFSVGTATTTNESGSDIIAYCFAEKKGFSKFGSYSGNGSTDGPFVYTGFKPAFIITKNISTSARNWQMYDNKRNTFNTLTEVLKPNLSDAEVTGSTTNIDALSNGFKLRGSSATVNASGDSYIYMAFAENPFVTSTGIPATAR